MFSASGGRIGLGFVAAYAARTERTLRAHRPRPSSLRAVARNTPTGSGDGEGWGQEFALPLPLPLTPTLTACWDARREIQ